MSDVAEAEVAVDAIESLSDPDPLALWHALANDPDSPDRIEITEHGEIIVSPSPTSRHQTIAGVVGEQLREQPGGRVIFEVSMVTRTAGIRCPDAAWLPMDRLAESLVDGPMETVPPVVVEVLSPGNRKTEIAHKMQAYLQSGAQ
ncbi:MAG: Uma2 family endonuclease, partial [Gammaproteobacteria bacterium]